MSVSYYDAIVPVRDLRGDPAVITSGLHLPHRAVGSILVPDGRVVVAFASDSASLTRMFAGNWARAEPGAEPDATLYALTRPARSYGLGAAWDGARWWSGDTRTMVVFGCGSYRLVKVCVRGICSAVSGDDVVFLHGCALALGDGSGHGVIVTGGSGSGKTTLVARLLRREQYPVRVINDDWGAVSLRSGVSVSTGERMLHMKSASVLALSPDCLADAKRGSYLPDLTDPARLLMVPEAAYGTHWDSGSVVIRHVAVIVREQAAWAPPAEPCQALDLLRNGGPPHGPHHELFFNGSLFLGTAADGRREERRYRHLLNRAAVCWINNCETPEALADRFLAAVMG